MFRDYGWPGRALGLGASALLLVLHCGRQAPVSPEALYNSIQDKFIAGQMVEAEADALRASSVAASNGPLWAAKFRLQRAWIETYRGDSPAVLALLEPGLPRGVENSDFLVTRGSLLAIAYHRSGDIARSDAILREVAAQCHDDAAQSQVHWAKGVIALDASKFDLVQRTFELTLAGARASGDKFLQTQALLNIGVAALRQDHYEDALERFHEVTPIAREIGAVQMLGKAEGDVGQTMYRMGDFPHALESAQAAEQLARTLGSTIDEASWLKVEGLSQYKMGDLKAARASFQRSYELARAIKNTDEMSDALFALASLSLQEGDLPGSLAQAREAERAAVQSGNSTSVLQPELLEAQVIARQGDIVGAQARLRDMLDRANQPAPRPFERWQIQSTLARLAAQAGDHAGSAKWFQQAIGTFLLQRESLSHVDYQLPFSENGTDLYVDYMEELLRQGKTEDALLVLDRSRAAALSEGSASTSAPFTYKGERSWSDLGAVARRLHGTILVYCLRPQNSYLWAVSPRGTSFFQLPGKETLAPLVEAHTRAVLAAKDVLSQENAPGTALYRALIEPAKDLVEPGGKVFVIADGELSHLNFETLIAPGERPHFWIEDVDIVNARSLGLLAARSSTPPATTNAKKLLLIGDPVYRRAEFVQLPHSAEEVANVAGHFAPERRLLLTGAGATRSAFLLSHPGDYKYIHFVSHATASETNPLDSAVILSAPPDEPTMYRLYARDIMNSRIQADLVTISACFGSGVRSYSGEGLVGLAWAFLRAGSHNVVGALWEVSDVSTPQLMNDLYNGLAAGKTPDVALRSAKLAMMQRGGAFRKPFYWGAFQLYSGA